MKMSKTLGRPREFDPNEALDRALEVFRRNGYEGSSLTDLTEAMGITKPSLYAAFGNKEDLFRKALDRYIDRASGVVGLLDTSPARDAIEGFLRASVEGQCDGEKARGCLLVQGALSCSDEGDHVRKELAHRRSMAEQKIRERLIRAQSEGELPSEVDVSALGRFYATVSQGLSVQASGGASREDLQAVVDMAMSAWPDRG